MAIFNQVGGKKTDTSNLYKHTTGTATYVNSKQITTPLSYITEINSVAFYSVGNALSAGIGNKCYRSSDSNAGTYTYSLSDSVLTITASIAMFGSSDTIKLDITDK